MWIVSIALLLHELLRFSRAAISSQQLALCCADTDYSTTNFLYCANGKDFSSAPISSCASCVSYQCIDWTFGSAANTVREATFFQETNEKVYFGVGSYSSANTDPGGLCYRITTSSLDRDLIVQIVNSGGDVSNGNVDLQTGDGGFGYYDACTQEDTTMPQFSGTATAWGNRYGGVSTRAECSNIPPYPICGTAPQDSMITLCQLSFDRGIRNGNPTISKICQVKCPSELVQATGVRRLDESNTLYTCNNNLDPAGGSLTKTMDCTKPSYAWPPNIAGPVDKVNGYSAVIPCRRDGYTRINKMPLAAGVPTAMPAVAMPPPTLIPVSAPTLDPTLCCMNTDYSKTNYLNCASGVTTTPIATCASCVAYQCIDWNVGSKGNAAREAAYFAQTGDSVYFGVGSYSNRTTSAGLCYRVKSPAIDRDLIVQILEMGYGTNTGNVNLQVGDGGFGTSHACTSESTTTPMFSGTGTAWGSIYGGATTRAQCSNLPAYPYCGTIPQDSMVDLCQFSFDKGFRAPGNPAITSICQVACPSQLVQATGLQRSDEKNSNFVCNNNFEKPGGVITRTMNCAKPSYAWTNNIGKPTVAGYSTAIPCRRDGYTRVNQMPAASLIPTAKPVSVSTSTTTRSPTSLRSNQPTKLPSTPPTESPTVTPTPEPTTRTPTAKTTRRPSKTPSTVVSGSPSGSPTWTSSSTPSVAPIFSTSTAPPTRCPRSSSSSSTVRPSCSPSFRRPTTSPSYLPSAPPTASPSTASPSITRTVQPTTRCPSTEPSRLPSKTPSARPTKLPSGLLTCKPTSWTPTVSPTSSKPSSKPTRKPASRRPSSCSTAKPSALPSFPSNA